MPDPAVKEAKDALDTAALPATEPHPAPIFDTGPHPHPLPGPFVTVRPRAATDTVGGQPRSVPAAPVVVPPQLHFLTWWKLVLALVAVWIPAAGVGLGLFAWWYSVLDKTPVVFVVFSYVAVCLVAGLMLAMVPEKPLVTAFAIALMSAVFASAIAAAPLYGHYFCQVKSPCLVGIIPY